MKREQLWDLRHSINRVKLDDPKLHDEISNSYKDEINNLLTINELEDLVQKIRYTSYLYDMIINFYKFLNTKNNQVEVSFVDLLSLLGIHGKDFTLKTFSQFANFFDHPMGFLEKMSRLELLNSIGLQKNLTFLKRFKIVTNTVDFDERFSLLKEIFEIKGELYPDDVWYVFRGKGSSISDLEKVKDLLAEKGNIEKNIRFLMKEHLVIQPQIKQKTEILKTWSNLFNTEDIKKLCNNLHITPEKLSDFLQVMRDQNGKLPESDRERINFLSFIVAYCNPKNNYLVYDDDNNECVDKGMYSLEKLIELGMHLKDDEIPF